MVLDKKKLSLMVLMMTQTTSNFPSLELRRNYLTNYLQQLTLDYQNTQGERHALSTNFEPSPDLFSPFEEIELLTVQLRGYAGQIQFQGFLSQPEQARSHLQSLEIFTLPSISHFYWETDAQYPLLKSYLQKLDYLRLLILDYLSSLSSG